MRHSNEITLANKYLFALIALLAIPLSGLSIDVYVPSLPAISQYFKVDKSLVQLSITAYMVGLGLMQLISGGISDSYGRKKPFLIALFLYILATLSITFTENIYQLLVLRFFQGLTMAILMVPIRSVIPDLFEGQALQKMMNYMVMAWSMGPIVAPAIGGYLQHFFGWHANFYFLAFYSCLVFILVAIYLPETSQHRHPFRMVQIIKRYGDMICHLEFLSGLLINCALYSLIILFAVVGPFLIQNVLHYSVIQFGHVALLTGLAWFLGAMTNRLLINMDLHFKTKYCLFIMFIVVLATVFMSIFLTMTLFIIVIPILLLLYLGGILFPNYFARGIHLFPKNSGSANALFGSVLFLIAGLISGVGSLLKSNNQLPLALAYLVLISFCLMVYFIGRKTPKL